MNASGQENLDEDRVRRRRRGRRIMLALFAVACAPVAASYLAYYLRAPAGRVNYGELLEPRPLPDPALESLDGGEFRLSRLRRRWVLVQFGTGRCDEACVARLFLMRQVRLMQGREMDRIERLWLLTDGATPDERLLRSFEGTQVARAQPSLLESFPAPGDPVRHIFLVDPLGNLVLRFPEDPDPKGMQRDIARLLRASGIG